MLFWIRISFSTSAPARCSSVNEHYEQISGTLKSTKSKTSNLLLSVIKTALRGPIQRCCSILIGFLILSFPPQDPDSVGPLTGAEQSIVITTASLCLYMSGCKCTGRDNRNKTTTHNLQEDEA